MGRGIAILLPLPSGPEALPGRRQGGGQPFDWLTALSTVEGEGDGVSVGMPLASSAPIYG